MQGEIPYRIPNGELSSRDAHARQPFPTAVTQNFIYLCSKHIGGVNFRRIGFQCVQKFLHSVELQAGAEIAGVELPLSDQARDACGIHCTGLHIRFQAVFIQKRNCLITLLTLTAHVNAAFAQMCAQVVHQRFS